MSTSPARLLTAGLPLFIAGFLATPGFAAGPATAGTPSPTFFDAGEKNGVTFHVLVDDSSGLLGKNAPLFRENLLAAAELWSRHLKGAVTLNLRVKVVPGAGRAYARCPHPVAIKKVGANHLYEPSAYAKLRSGVSKDDGAFDIEMTVMGDYLKEFWFDPSPRERTATPPPASERRFDAVSLFLHEIAHGLGMDGWLDPKTGELREARLSTYDRFVVYDGGEFYFVGLRAMKAHGGPLFLSRKNNTYHHLGREGAGCPEDLRTDLMNGVIFQYGRRYSISPLDLAILEDCGLPVK